MGPLHAASQYPASLDSHGNKRSLMHSMAHEYEIPILRKTDSEKKFHTRSFGVRADVFKKVERKRNLEEMPAFWTEQVSKLADLVDVKKDPVQVAAAKKLKTDVNTLWKEITDDMKSAPLSYMDMMQRHSHKIIPLDHRIYDMQHQESGGPSARQLKAIAKGLTLPEDDTDPAQYLYQKQFQLLPAVVKRAKALAQKWEKQPVHGQTPLSH